ncbi:MAG: hypothetical protein ABSG37_12005 [Candidatus Limnocylindrales bacterium]
MVFHPAFLITTWPESRFVMGWTGFGRDGVVGVWGFGCAGAVFWLAN